MSILGVYHIGCIGKYKSIIKEQLSLLHKKLLYEKIKHLVIFLSKKEVEEEIKTYDPKFKFIFHYYPIEERENYTINHFRTYLTDDIKKVFYFHTKGVSRDNPIFHRRRKILNYYILEHYDLCIELLEEYNVVGCSLYRFPQIHFSGNFWWTTTSYLDTLPKKINNNYLTPEMFIGYTNRKHPKYCSLSQRTNMDSLEIHKKRSYDIIKKDIKETPLLNYRNRSLIKFT